ncbi:cubilin-like [Daphnia magna]|uniref:cubilin-like n=1 Tax=Daphnia magna TaxID=35525 RepID=UPI001E1BD9C7|nr:cubilin-like [Daphnia magna]
MNRVIFGITAAGVSALTVYHWYSARKREVISSTDVDNLNGRSSVYPHVLSETGIREGYSRVHIHSQYTDTWNGPSTSLEILAKGNEVANNSLDSNEIWRCQRKHFYCEYNGCWPSDHSYVCDGQNHCRNDRDEQYCDQVCKDGFKCGRQCIPNELVCNGNFDCLGKPFTLFFLVPAGYDNMCQQFTNSSGNFSSLIIPKPVNEIRSDRMSDIVRKTAVLISVEPNHQIWLTFEKCVTSENKHFVKIYDGPYSTSPLLLSRSGSLSPFSVRSSSNELYVEFPSYYDVTYGITAVYSSINATSEPFILGCGGYIKGEGVISTPTYSANPDIADCFWFLETKNSEDTIVLSNSDFLSYQRMKLISTTARSSEYDHYGRWQNPSPVSTVPPLAESPSLIIHDGWSTEGLVLYDGEAKDQRRAVAYSISNKMMVHLTSPEIREQPAFSWTVSRISTPQCNHTFDGSNGIIKSPNYPLVYSHLSDCRWNIDVKSGLKIRLLFAFFETQDQADFLYVYDGPTVYSKLLLEKSGSITPFEITSTSNQVLLRFLTDANTAFPGFLVVYSTV